MTDRVIIFDTTLRDGEQSPGASMNLSEKMEVARALQALKVDVIEAGFPISSPGDFESVKTVAQEIKGPGVAGLARAHAKDIDRCWEAVQYSDRPRIHTFIATSPIHIEKKLRKTPEQVIEIAVGAVQRAKGYCDDVEFSCEDAARSDRKYLCKIVEAVIEAGATTINIPDTVGYSNPWEFGQLIGYLVETIPNSSKAIFSVHCHNDLGLAVANSLAGLKAGARQAECTINGIGERAGNASMEEIAMNLFTRKAWFGLECGIDTTQIYRASRLVSSVTGIQVQRNKAVVGENAFAHEAGIHQDGMIKHRETYEIMTPESVGWKGTSMVLGKHSGRNAFNKRMKELGFDLSQEMMEKCFEQFKVLADKKKDIYDADLFAIVEDEAHTFPEKYHLEYIQTTSGNTTLPTAMVKILKGDDVLEGAGTGDGPVDAAYATIRRLTETSSKLVHFNIQSITGGTDAVGEVVVTLEEDGRRVTGRGRNTDVIVASALAYLDALNRLEFKREKKVFAQSPTTP